MIFEGAKVALAAGGQWVASIFAVLKAFGESRKMLVLLNLNFNPYFGVYKTTLCHVRTD
jgi:hypothetical protein